MERLALIDSVYDSHDLSILMNPGLGRNSSSGSGVGTHRYYSFVPETRLRTSEFRAFPGTISHDEFSGYIHFVLNLFGFCHFSEF